MTFLSILFRLGFGAALFHTMMRSFTGHGHCPSPNDIHLDSDSYRKYVSYHWIQKKPNGNDHETAVVRFVPGKRGGTIQCLYAAMNEATGEWVSQNKHFPDDQYAPGKLRYELRYIDMCGKNNRDYFAKGA